jgi:hypothetical protein
MPKIRKLDVIAAAIDVEHEAVVAAFKTGFERGARLGELLAEAKSAAPHGQWLPWLRDNTGISARRAQAFMRLATNADQIRANASEPAHLSIDAALQTIAATPADHHITQHVVDMMTSVPDSPEDREAWKLAKAELGSFLSALRTNEICPLGKKAIGVAGRQRVVLYRTSDPKYIHYAVCEADDGTIPENVVGSRKPVAVTAIEDILHAHRFPMSQAAWEIMDYNGATHFNTAIFEPGEVGAGGEVLGVAS